MIQYNYKKKGLLILNIKDMIVKYIDTYDNNVPIFMNDIKEYVLKNVNNINEKQNIEEYIISQLKHYLVNLRLVIMI